MKNFLSVLIPVFLVLTACNKYDPGKLMDKEQLKELLVKVTVYTEQKPEGVSYEDRFKPEFKEYYKAVAEKLNISFHQLYKKDSLNYFLITKNAPKSLHGDLRGVGGVFKVIGDSIAEMDIKFVTPMLPKEDMVRKSEEMFKAMVEEGSLENYFGRPDFMEWPNPDVAYNKKTNRWYFPEGSKLSVYENIMTGQE